MQRQVQFQVPELSLSKVEEHVSVSEYLAFPAAYRTKTNNKSKHGQSAVQPKEDPVEEAEGRRGERKTTQSHLHWES